MQSSGAAAFAALVALAPAAALAQDAAGGEGLADLLTKGVTLIAGGSAKHDSNLFKRQEAVSETIRTGYIGLRANLPYSLQRFQFDVTRSSVHYNHLQHLNFTGTDYRGAWLWSLTPRVSGTVSAERKEAQVPFFDFQGTERNIRVTNNRAFALDGDVGRGVHALFGLSRQEQSSSVPFAAQADFRLDRWEAGMKYLPSAGNSLSLVYRKGTGEYFHREFDPSVTLDNRFKQDEVEGRATWLASGRSVLNTRITWMKRRHEHFSELDSSGYGGEAGWAWAATGKVGLSVIARRTIVPYFDANTSHRVDKSFALSPRWQVVPRLSATASFTRTQSDYLGASGTTTTGDERKDTFNIFDSSLAWQVSRRVNLGAGIQRLRRHSNETQFAFDATIYQANASLSF